METCLIQYIKNRKGQSIGCVIARKVLGENLVYVSGSLCCNQDTFDKKIAYNLAADRAFRAAQGRICALPRSLKPTALAMVNRAGRYFKGHAIITPNFK